MLEGDRLRTGLAPGELARRLCGDAVDGLLVVDQPRARAMPVSIHNRDGSPGGACLNGLRMAALWTGEARGTFEMAGRRVPWQLLGPEVVELHLRAQDLPEELAFQSLEIEGREALAVPFWNPHCVVLSEDVEAEDLERLATEAARCEELFPRGVNVETVSSAGPGKLRVRVWERGVGETRACGSGAVAVALAAWASGYEEAVTVEMAGGSLVVGHAADGGILLAGPAALGETTDRAFA